MSDTERKSFRQKLDELSRRIEARVRDLKEKGQFSDMSESSMLALQTRQQNLAQRVNAAERSGTTWELTKAELARDFGSLFDDFVQLEQDLDASRMKKR